MFFNQQAQHWDTSSRIKRANIIADEIKQNIKLEKTWTALEFGAGTGLISFNLADDLDKITMIDTSQTMIEISNQKILDKGIKNIRAFNIGIETIIENGDQFNLIYASMALHHIVDTNDIIAKFKKALLYNGVLCIVDLDLVSPKFHRDDPTFNGHHGFNQANLKEILNSNGFNFCSSHTFYNSKKLIDDQEIEYSMFIMLASFS